MNHEGRILSQAAKPSTISQALLRNASLRQKASEQGHDGGMGCGFQTLMKGQESCLSVL